MSDWLKFIRKTHEAIFRRINDDKNFSILSFALFFIVLLPMPSFLSEGMQLDLRSLCACQLLFLFNNKITSFLISIL